MTADLIIFDCDGVLIDSEPLASRVFWQALNNAGADISHAEVHRRFTGYSETDAKRICAEELGIEDVEGVFAEASANLYPEFARALTPMPGIVPVVHALHQPKCVASNSTVERLKNSLGLFDLWNEFAPNVFSAEMVDRPKPAPDLFLFCAQRFGIEPARCLIIDDSAHGIAGAVAAGMRAIGFIDPADPREGRHEVLAGAGAICVVTGADELSKAFDTVLSTPARHSPGRDVADLPVDA
ncbi:MAG: hydrolase [Shinella sp.]|nr:MAG: hydrolase [Shinella sp.]